MTKAIGALVLLSGFFIGLSSVQTDGFLDRLMDRATQSLESAVSQQVDKTLNKTIDKLDDCLSIESVRNQRRIRGTRPRPPRHHPLYLQVS